MKWDAFAAGVCAALIVIFRLDWAAYYVMLGIAYGIASDDESFGLTATSNFIMNLLWPVSLVMTIYFSVRAWLGFEVPELDFEFEPEDTEEPKESDDK